MSSPTCAHMPGTCWKTSDQAEITPQISSQIADKNLGACASQMDECTSNQGEEQHCKSPPGEVLYLWGNVRVQQKPRSLGIIEMRIVCAPFEGANSAALSEAQQFSSITPKKASISLSTSIIMVHAHQFLWTRYN